MNLVLLSIVLFPFAAGASYYLGGSVVGTLWTGLILFTCFVIHSALFRAKP